MVTSCRAVLLTWLCGACLLSSPAWAQGPLVLREYRFVPELSSLHVEGGFAYVNVDLPITGTFGLATGIQSNSTQLDPFAQFVFVDAVASDGLWELDLDWALNLTGLEGSFDLAEPQDLVFTGVEGQGQPMNLQANLRRRRAHLVGANRAGCCDMFSYSLDAVAVRLPRLGPSMERMQSSLAVPEPCTGWMSWLAVASCLIVARLRRGVHLRPRLN